MDGSLDGRMSEAMTQRLQHLQTNLTCTQQTPLDKSEQDLQGHKGDLQNRGFPKNVAVELESLRQSSTKCSPEKHVKTMFSSSAKRIYIIFTIEQL